MFNNISLPQQASPSLGYSQRQTNAQANNLQAQADSAFDTTRMTSAFDRRGFSRGRGQGALGQLMGAKKYSAGSDAANQLRMSDAYENANLNLQDQSRRQDFGLALAGLQEQMRQDRFDGSTQLADQLMRLLGGFGPR